jgi:hypothetical protein
MRSFLSSEEFFCAALNYQQKCVGSLRRDLDNDSDRNAKCLTET